jgi:nicotinamidase-related amidase
MFDAAPKSVCLAPRKSGISRRKKESLSTYLDFLSIYSNVQKYQPAREEIIERSKIRMAAAFDSTDPSSPLAYDASQTALVLMDFQNFIVGLCGGVGRDALAKATSMRNWALEQKMMILHSVVDVRARPPPTTKGGERLNGMLDQLLNDPSASEEPEEIAFSQRHHEYVSLKWPGHVSGLKAQGARDILQEHNIKSLILCGLSTSGCVLRTTIPSTDDGFIVTVIEDACADPTPGLHDTLMKSVIPSRAHVTTAEEFIQHWGEKSGG